MSKSSGKIFLFIAGFGAGITTLIFLVVFIIIIAANSSQLIVRPDSYLVIDFEGDIKERPVSDIPDFLAGNNRVMELSKILESIKKAAVDQNIQGLLINGDLTGYSRTHIEEIGIAIENFKFNNKEVIAWFSRGNNSNYLLSSYADRIYMPQTASASLSIKGYAMTIPYIGEAFDNIGLDFNVIHSGDFKGTGENYVRSDMSDNLRSSYKNFLDSYLSIYIDTVSANRNIESSTIYNLLQENALIMADANNAIEYNLIDATADYYSLMNVLEGENWKHPVSIYNYSKTLSKTNKQTKIAVLYIDGTIIDDYSGSSPFNEDYAGAKSIINDIIKIKADDSIKAVVVRINSPGGSALASEMVHSALNELKKDKPVYTSFGTISASGGYYIGCVGDGVFTNRSTLTGSIGVVSILANYSELSTKLGINFETIKKYSMDDIFSPSRPPSSEEIALLRHSMDRIYDEFKFRVTSNRDISEAGINELAEGRIWTGEQAVSNRLADLIGGLYDTIRYASIQNGIEEYAIVSYPTPPGLWDSVFSGTSMRSNSNIFSDILNKLDFYLNNSNTPLFYEVGRVIE